MDAIDRRYEKKKEKERQATQTMIAVIGLFVFLGYAGLVQIAPAFLLLWPLIFVLGIGWFFAVFGP